jgi:low affinity Fe/Cu permease
MTLHNLFRRFARATSNGIGSPIAFVFAVIVVLAWAVTGPFFGYSETWQLVINTGTTIITFLVVFMIQNTQNRDSRAVHLKLDELIRVIKEARNELVDVEDKADEVIERYQEEFKDLEDIREPARKLAHRDEESADAASDAQARTREAVDDIKSAVRSS